MRPDERGRAGDLSEPGGFYFNVHTTLNPGGVMRGQLVKGQ